MLNKSPNTHELYFVKMNTRKCGFFRHKDMPISADDAQQIKPMTSERAAVLWSTMVSFREHDHPDFFDKTDWCGKEESFNETLNWENALEAGEEQLPEAILAHLDWPTQQCIFAWHATISSKLALLSLNVVAKTLCFS